MRPAAFNKVLFIAFAVLAVRSESAPAQSTSRSATTFGQGVARTNTGDEKPTKTWIVTGEWFASYKDAEEDALETGLGHVLNYLAERKPPIEWKPDADYVRQRLVRDLNDLELKQRIDQMEPGEAQKIERTRIQINGYHAAEEQREFADKDEQHPIGRLRRVVLKVALSPRDLGDIQEKEQYFQVENRHTQAGLRQLMLAKFLAGLVAVLAAIGGYFRLEDATKGYYTAWLRLGAVSFVALIGASIWYFS